MHMQVVSAVVFLSCCSCAGPTIVLEECEASGAAGKAWAAYPSEGAVLLYPGDLLHGVLPGKYQKPVREMETRCLHHGQAAVVH